ncbi:MAG TPA: hypothetical protein VGL03_02565 [Thermoanaerobaculia bacterium]
MTPSKAISKYLSLQAEPEAAAADRLEGRFGHVLIVPAYGEGESLFDALGSVPRGPRGETLVIVVLNARSDSPPHVHQANAAARDRLRGAASRVEEIAQERVAVLSYPDGKIVVIDRAGPGRFLPEGQGVGLARKVGNDFALRLYGSGRIESPWIHNTDADTVLTNDYFEQTDSIEVSGNAAALYFFEHCFGDDEALARAARLYEISLRYYTLGLAWAGSPYAYQNMGSCVAIRPLAYAEVRGFPKKNAAEDFYILNKLAKVGSIVRLAGAPLRLEGRISDRVPFGTGKALSQLVSRRHAVSGFRLYHPLVFAHLAAWLRVLSAIARSGGQVERALGELPCGNPFFSTDLLVGSLERMGAFPAMREAIARSGDAPTILRHFHAWFDALRTLKLVHALRDGGLASLPYREALAEAPFTGLSTSTEDDVEALRTALAERERQLAAAPAGVSAAV